MLEDLLADDFYIAFGKRARVLPDDATKETHEVERDGLKTVALGVGYGMQEQSLAVRLAKTCPEARELLQTAPAHLPPVLAMERRCSPIRQAVRQDLDHVRMGAEQSPDTGRDQRHQGSHAAQLPDAGQRQRNAPDRLLPVRRARRSSSGASCCGPVHDALLVECATDAVDDAIDFTRGVMDEASRAVLNGFTLGVDVKVWRYPQRFMDEKRGRATWERSKDICGKRSRTMIGVYKV